MDLHLVLGLNQKNRGKTPLDQEAISQHQIQCRKVHFHLADKIVNLVMNQCRQVQVLILQNTRMEGRSIHLNLAMVEVVKMY